MSNIRSHASAKSAQSGAAPGVLDPKREGEKMNRLILKFMRHLDSNCRQSVAERARRMNTNHQQVEHLHSKLKVVTLPLFLQWCLSHGINAGDLMSQIQTMAEQQQRPRH